MSVTVNWMNSEVSLRRKANGNESRESNELGEHVVRGCVRERSADGL